MPSEKIRFYPVTGTHRPSSPFTEQSIPAMDVCGECKALVLHSQIESHTAYHAEIGREMARLAKLAEVARDVHSPSYGTSKHKN